MAEEQMEKEKHKDVYIEVLRIVAVFLVIFNHTDGYFLYYSNTENPLTWWFSFLGSVLCRINVPLFIMITGALLLEKEESISTLFRKRIRRIGIILVLFSFFYYIVDICRNPGVNFSPGEFLRGLLGGTIQESFWYLYLYIGILLLMPLLRKLAISCADSELKYLLFLQFALGTGAGIFSHLTGIAISSNLYFFNIYIFYLLAGYYLGKRVDLDQIPKRWISISVVLITLCLLGNWIMVRLDYIEQGSYDQGLLELFTPVLATGIFLDVRWICRKYKMPSKIEKLICQAGSCVFGIYLLEQLARIQLLPLYLYLTEISFGVLACSCYVAGSFLLAWLYTALLKKLPGLGRLL